MIQTGMVIAGRYHILREIGRGGMSVVYLAEDIRLNKLWAIKESKKSDSGQQNRVITNSLTTEVNMLKRLHHHAIPQIVDMIDNGDTIAIVMDYVEGESLSAVIKHHGPQLEEDVVEWGIQLCDVLSYLHNQKPRPVIYRDMKPSNVMLRPDGTIAILDLGIAREYKEYSTSDTTVLGTRGYAPPEQYVGQTDARSDIYALGMTLRHLLTGMDPNCQDTTESLHTCGVTVSPEMEAILRKCTQPAAEKRYQNCHALYGDLLKLRQQQAKRRQAEERKNSRNQKRELAAKEKTLPKEPKPPKEKPENIGRKTKLPLILTITLAAVLLLTGIVWKTITTKNNNSHYDALVNISTADALSDKIDSYKAAVEIYPERPEAYIKILEAYENEEVVAFGQKESATFLALYDANKGSFDPAAKETAELNYKAGRMYFNYYGGVTGSFSTKVQKAYNFFAANKENDSISPEFQERALSDCYYDICAFYKKFILGNSVEEPSLQEYQKLFNTIDNAMNSVRNAGAYDQLTLYNGTFNLLFDQCEEMASVNFDKQTVLELFDEVYRKAQSLSVNTGHTRQLRDEILNNYENYRAIIEQCFARADR